MGARSHGRTGSKPRSPALRTASGRAGRKRKTSQSSSRGTGRGTGPAGRATAPLTTPTPMEGIAPLGGEAPAIDGGEVRRALASLPAFFVLRLVNAAFVLRALWDEGVRGRRLTVYEKGH